MDGGGRSRTDALGRVGPNEGPPVERNRSSQTENLLRAPLKPRPLLASDLSRRAHSSGQFVEVGGQRLDGGSQQLELPVDSGCG